MEQNPVPQNISLYQFDWVGDMTLKQFLELATGVVIGVIIYATALPGLIKWPLIFFSAISGAALAFVPFEERPLEQWIFAFFRSIYSPTLFHWQKQSTANYFQPEQAAAQAITNGIKPATNSTFSRSPLLSKLEEGENTYLGKIAQLFNPSPSLGAVVPVATQTITQTGITNSASVPAPVATAPHFTEGFGLTNQDGAVLTAHLQDDSKKGQLMPETKPTGIQIPKTTLISVDINKGVESRPHIF